MQSQKPTEKEERKRTASVFVNSCSQLHLQQTHLSSHWTARRSVAVLTVSHTAICPAQPAVRVDIPFIIFVATAGIIAPGLLH